MGLPKKIKKYIPLTESKTLLPRRRELRDQIEADGTFLPKSLLHADLDRGFLDFVRDELKCVVEGKTIPMIDILITTQNWAQFVETWDFQNIDKNSEPPFITVIRTPEVKYGNNPSIIYNIPNRKLYFYAKVPTWDGNKNGYDIYKIPQPVPVDITYTVAIICNRMREVNKFNQIVIEKFASLQAYQTIKGHYIPIKMNSITDESVMELEKRKYYIQKYEFTMNGFLIDEDQFEVSPAITRTFQIFETETKYKKNKYRSKIPPEPATYDLVFPITSDEVEELFNYTLNLNLTFTDNISSFQVYINGDYYGNDLDKIIWCFRWGRCYEFKVRHKKKVCVKQEYKNDNAIRNLILRILWVDKRVKDNTPNMRKEIGDDKDRLIAYYKDNYGAV